MRDFLRRRLKRNFVAIILVILIPVSESLAQSKDPRSLTGLSRTPEVERGNAIPKLPRIDAITCGVDYVGSFSTGNAQSHGALYRRPCPMGVGFFYHQDNKIPFHVVSVSCTVEVGESSCDIDRDQLNYVNAVVQQIIPQGYAVKIWGEPVMTPVELKRGCVYGRNGGAAMFTGPGPFNADAVVFYENRANALVSHSYICTNLNE